MEYIIEVPIKGLKAPKSRGSRSQLKDVLLSLNNNYRKFYDFASKHTNIPIQVLMSFSGVESMGKPRVSSGFATGLMQWDYRYVKSYLETEKKTGRLSPEEESVLNKYKIFFDKNGKTRNITQLDGFNPELNILIGAIILGQIISEIGLKSKGWSVDEGNKLRLDKIVAIYNGGAYSEVGKLAQTSVFAGQKVDTTSVNNFRDYASRFKRNKITPIYIDLFLGVDGFMDIITSDLKNLF